MNVYDRSISLIGENAIKELNSINIAIIGLGGVGGTAAEALLRSGVKSFVLVDKDIVDESNLNRQILYKYSDINKDKVTCASNHLLDIVPDVHIDNLKICVDETTINELDKYHIDFLVDAIDMVSSKIILYKYCLEHNIKFISCLGMGNRLDPSKVYSTTLDKTFGDPLAKKIRSELRKENIDISLINVILSSEVPLKHDRKPSSMIMVPSSAGLLISKYVINLFTE